MTARDIASMAGWSLAHMLGLYSITQHLVEMWEHGDSIPTDLFSPWYFVADLYRLATIFSLVKLYSHADPHLWLSVVLTCEGLRLAWEWRWGFLCWPRRTCPGRWLDRRLAYFDAWLFNSHAKWRRKWHKAQQDG